MHITNLQSGPRGINTVNGPVLVNPGQTVEAKVYAREKEHLDASGWFKIEGGYTANPPQPGAAAAPAPDQNALITDMQQQIEAKDAEITGLKAKLAAKDGGATATLEAKHRGGGSYSVLDAAGAEIVEKLDKDAAEKFNAMSDADKAAFVEKNKKPAA